MHLETAGEGPTNQVLQIHKSIASAKSIQAIFLFALILLLDQLIDAVFSFYFHVFFPIAHNLKKDKISTVNMSICAVRVLVKKFMFWVIS